MQTSVLAVLATLSCVWLVGYARVGRGSVGSYERRTYLQFLALGAGSLASVLFGGQKGFAILLLMALAVLTALVAALWKPSVRHPGVPAPKRVAVAMLMLWLWLFSVDMVSNQLSVGRMAAYLAAALIPLLTWLFGLTASLSNRVVATVCTTYLAVSNIVALADVTAAWRQCDQFKCNYIGALYKGPFISENFVAILSAFALVEWLTVEKASRGRRTGIALCFAMLLASGSRGSLIGVAAAMAWGLLAQARGRVSGRVIRVPSVISLVTAVGFCAVAYHLIANATYEQFSNRGNVWLQAFSHIRDGHVLYGLGLSSWEDLQAAGELPAHFAHSQFLILLFAGGLVAWSLFVLVFTVAMSRPADPSASRGAAWNGAPIVFILVTGLVEVVWNPASWDAFSFLIIGAFAQTFAPTPESAKRPVHDRDSQGRVLRPRSPMEAPKNEIHPRPPSTAGRSRTGTI